MVCFLKGLRNNLLCRGENKMSNHKPCLYTGDPCEGVPSLAPQTKNPRYGPECIIVARCEGIRIPESSKCEALESRIQNVESGIHCMESRIHRRRWNAGSILVGPVSLESGIHHSGSGMHYSRSGIHGLESGIQGPLGFLYIGRIIDCEFHFDSAPTPVCILRSL